MAAKSRQDEWKDWKFSVRRQLVHRLRLRGTTKVILVAIMQSLGSNAWCWPSEKWLADFCGRSIRTVQLQITKLLELGLIETSERFERDTGRQQSNFYRIVWRQIGRLTESAPMAAWKRPEPLSPRCAARRNCAPPAQVAPQIAPPPRKVIAPRETNEVQGSSLNPPPPPGWASAQAAVAEFLKVAKARDRASSEACKHGLSSDDVLALVSYYRANASAFRSAGILASVLREAPPGCAANPGEHFPALSPQDQVKELAASRHRVEAEQQKIQKLGPVDIGRLIRSAAERDHSLTPLVDEYETKRWLDFPKERYRSLLAAEVDRIKSC